MATVSLALQPRAALARPPAPRGQPARRGGGGLWPRQPRRLATGPRAALPDLPNVRKEISKELPPEVRTDLPAWLSLVGYAALHFTHFRHMPSEGLLYQGLAAYQLAWAGLSLLSNNYEFDRIGSVVAPGFLGVRALPVLASRISAWDTAAALFGYFLARRLPGPVWAWLGTLAAAIYYGYTAEWVVAAFGLASVLKLAEHFHRGAGVLPSLGQVAFAGLAGWGLYAGQAPLLALVIFGGQLVASAVSDA